MSRASRKSKPTPSSNKHVFEPFSRRIARLRIDPVHTIRGRNATEETSDLSQSYFRTSLEEWSSLNLTSTFTTFLRGVNPLSENLPQLLYHADTIFDLLVHHIEKKDHLALEPLLDLTAHFAHDLGQEFEKYFGRTVSLVASVAASQDRPEVVEWSFTCLAWMFKYLSRLLVQDLRPLLKIFRPYLSARKEHVSRFSAESLAFLIRKASVLYPKKKSPLTLALTELLNGEAISQEEAQRGAKILLVESCLGVDTQLHSGAEHLVSCLISLTADHDSEASIHHVMRGFLIGLLHDTDATSFEPVVKTIVDFSQNAVATANTDHMYFAADLLKVIIAVRKGVRIADWSRIPSVVTSLCQSAPTSPVSTLLPRLQMLAALVLQYAPMDHLLPAMAGLLDASTAHLASTQFFSYCTTMADLGKERFQQFMLPRLQKYIVQNFGDDDFTLSFALDQLRQREVITPKRSSPGFIESTKNWDVRIHRSLLENEDAISPEIIAKLRFLLGSIHFPCGTDMSKQICQSIQKLVMKSLATGGRDLNLQRRMCLGWLLEAYVSIGPTQEQVEIVWGALGESLPHYLGLLPFTRACNGLATKYKLTELAESQTVRAIDAIVPSLLMNDLAIREQSLLLLSHVGEKKGGQWLQQSTEILLGLIRTPYLPANARAISMQLRRLPQLQKACPKVASLQTLLPYFCLGMLQQYHDQSRKDLSTTLGELVANTPLEDTVLDVLTSWLRTPDHSPEAPSAKQAPLSRSSQFQDATLLHIDSLSQQASELYEDTVTQTLTNAEEVHFLHVVRPPALCRSLALSALSEMAALVERRSRLITPIFLAAQFTRSGNDGTEHAESSDSSETLSPDVVEGEWSLPNRKAFVKLLASFQNPRVLFRAAEAYERLLELLCNGNADIRKQALIAVLKWKDATLLKHETIFMKIVDEKIPSTEIGIMLNTESEENPIEPDERPVVLPILLRLIYGLLVGRSGTYGSQESRRKILLRMLFRMEAQEIALFLKICLGKLRDVNIVEGSSVLSHLTEREFTSPDQRYGFVRMALTLLTILQSQFAPFGKHVVDAVLYCTLRASMLADEGNAGHSSIERNIRKIGIQCLTMIFQLAEDVDWNPYMRPLFAGVVIPRLSTFATENSQGISALLHLFAAWSQELSSTAYLTSFDDRVLPEVFNTLGSPAAKSEVKVFILNDILLPLLRNAKADGSSSNTARQAVLQHSKIIVDNMALLLSSAPTADVLKAITTSLLELAPIRGASGGTGPLITLLVDLLSSSKHRLSPMAKSTILTAIDALLQADPAELDTATFDKLFNAVSSLFSYFKDQPNRQILGIILQRVSRDDDNLLHTTKICQDLNAVSSTRLDEVDFDRRANAFQQVSSLSIDEKTQRGWTPILHNLLFYSHDEDFSIRSNAVSSLRNFISRAAPIGTIVAQVPLKEILLPAFRKGLTDDSEVVRADQVSLFGLLVQVLDDEQLKDMQPLLVGSDEEASFFTNILHIQQHRRLRAIRRLVTEVEKGALSATNISQVLIPLLSKFIRDESQDESVQTVKGQALAAMKTLLQWITWKQFKAVFRQYKSDLERDEGIQKTAIKMLGQAADALVGAWEQRVQEPTHTESTSLSHLTKSLPAAETLAAEVKDDLLAKMSDFVHYRDEAEMSARLPAATVAVKLTKLLSPEDGQTQSAPIVLDVANVLKSRAQESRDAGRNVLVDIVVLLGGQSMQFVLRQMRTALQRGYQLHVLSYTMHSILIALAPTLQIGDLDYCTSDLTAVIMDDIFGSVGQEKENEDYISSMREVKRNKSFDSMELIAQSTGLDHLSSLIQPIATLLTGALTTKQVHQVDELLRRLGVGVAHNPLAGDRGLLVFAYQTIQNFYKEKAAPAARQMTLAERNRTRFLVQKSSAELRPQSFLLFKVARFAIDLVRSALVKHNELMTAENVHGFLPVLGDALIEGQEDVKISALRLLASIIKLRMPELDENCPLYVMEAVKVVRNCTNTNEEAAQAALKFVAAVLREKKSVKVRDFDIAEVLKRIMPDLDDPDRQGVTFNFIRAVLARKYQLPEVYEAVDKIAVMMVISQGRASRDLARGVYVHFLIDYPQTSSRWTKQQKFLIKNLEYDHPEGRQSVMEAMNTLLNKLQGDSAQQLVSAFFVPIVLRIANDDHESCRELAGALLGQLFTKADSERVKALLEPLQGWIDQDENSSLLKLSLQAYTMFFRVVGHGFDEQVRMARSRIAGLLQQERTVESGELVFDTLQLFSVLVSTRPAAALSTKAEAIWASVRGLLSHSQGNVRKSSAELVVSFLESCQSDALSRLPLTNLHGLRWSEDALQDLFKGCTRLIKNNQSDADLNATVQEVLVLLASAAFNSGLTMPLKDNSEKDPSELLSDGNESDVEADVHSSNVPGGSISATQYLLDQLAYILRHETSILSTAAFLPKTTALSLLSTLTNTLPATAFPQPTLTRLLTPLIYLTSNTSGTPQSADLTFATTYANLTTSASEVMAVLQERVGDKVYVKAMTDASRAAREKREERRRKRKVERVADPEGAARRKRRMGERKKERKREVGRQQGDKRRGRAF